MAVCSAMNAVALPGSERSSAGACGGRWLAVTLAHVQVGGDQIDVGYMSDKCARSTANTARECHSRLCRRLPKQTAGAPG